MSSFDDISKTHNHSIEHSDSDEMTSKKHNLTFCRSIVKSNQVVIRDTYASVTLHKSLNCETV
jgi:hypothetical protein